MGITEKAHRLKDTLAWQGDYGIWHQYTLGRAGERFFRAIMENRRLMASRCGNCGSAYLPPKLYCPDCFEELDEWVEVPPEGSIRSFTVLHRDLEDRPLEEPLVVAFITFPGIRGGLVHRLEGVTPAGVKEGLAVVPIFRPKPEGGPNDILHFQPASR